MKTSPPSPLDPLYPSGFVREYQRLLVVALRRFYSAAIKLIRDFLKLYRDALLDDLVGRMRGVWQLELQGLAESIRSMYRRLSRTHFARWLQTLAAATGAPEEAFQYRIIEPWLQSEEDSRVQNNLAQATIIGTTLLMGLESTLRNGLRSNLPKRTIFEAITEAERLREKQAASYATNQIQEQWSVLTQRRQMDAGVPGYIWLHTKSRNPRSLHLRRVGEFFAWLEPPDDGHPGSAPYCQCGAKPAFAESVYGIDVFNRYKAENQGLVNKEYFSRLQRGLPP